MKTLFIIFVTMATGLAADKPATWPPQGTFEVRAYGFSGGPNDCIVKDGRIHTSAFPQSGVELTSEQIQTLSAALNAPRVPFGTSMICFEPRDGIVFFDKNHRIIASVSICFTCRTTYFEPDNLRSAVNYPELAKFFATLKLKKGYQFESWKADAYNREYFRQAEERRRKFEKSGMSLRSLK